VVVSSISYYVELLVYDTAPVAIIIVLRQHGYYGLDELRFLPQMIYLNFLHYEKASLYLIYHDLHFLGSCPVFMQTDGLCHISAILNMEMVHK